MYFIYDLLTGFVIGISQTEPAVVPDGFGYARAADDFEELHSYTDVVRILDVEDGIARGYYLVTIPSAEKELVLLKMKVQSLEDVISVMLENERE